MVRVTETGDEDHQLMEIERPQRFDVFAADYDRFSALTNPALLDWLLAHVPPHGDRALDVGCGAGHMTLSLADRFDEVIGVDISQPMIALARRRAVPNVHFCSSDLTTFRDPIGFDLVISFMTLHHVPDLDAGLKHLHELLRPAGTMLLVDNVASRPTPGRWIHVLGAFRRFPRDWRRRGHRDAQWLLRFRTSRRWLDHLASDRYLSREQFMRRYETIFPGARFHDLGYAQGLIWQAPSPG